MNSVVLEADAARTEEHVEWNEELQQGHQQPNWYHVGWPEEEKGVKHV